MKPRTTQRVLVSLLMTGAGLVAIGLITELVMAVWAGFGEGHFGTAASRFVWVIVCWVLATALLVTGKRLAEPDHPRRADRDWSREDWSRWRYENWSKD